MVRCGGGREKVEGGRGQIRVPIYPLQVFTVFLKCVCEVGYKLCVVMMVCM